MARNKGGGHGGNKGGGGNNKGVPNFGTWGQGGQLSIFSNTNERNAAKTLQKGYEKGLDSATNRLQGGWQGLKNQYGNALDTLAGGAATGRSDITAGRDAGVNALYGGQTNAINSLYGGQTSGINALYGGQNQGVNALTQGRDAGLSSLYAAQGQGVGALTQGRDAALAGFSPYAQTGAAANAMYGNATGLNGAAGNAAATNAFQAGPGYEWQMQQGQQAIDRGAASRGMLGSGNTMIDAMTYGQGLANQEYGSWLDRLAGQQAMGVNVAGQTGAINTTTGQNLSNLYANTGASAANLQSTTGQNLSNLYANTGANAANLYSTTGQAAGGVYTGTGQNVANAYNTAGSNLANIATDTAARQGAVYTGLGDQRYEYGSDLAGLDYSTRLGQATAQANYLAGTDALGANVINLATGSANTAANILNPAGKAGQSSTQLWSGG